MPNSDLEKSNSDEEETKNTCSSSPKKVRPKSSPTSNNKQNFIHTSTSPSLPLVPPTQSSRNSFSAPSELVAPSQYASGYGNGNPPLEGPVPLHYQPSPCFVYASYGVSGPSQYDGRLVCYLKNIACSGQFKILFVLGHTNARGFGRLFCERSRRCACSQFPILESTTNVLSKWDPADFSTRWNCCCTITCFCRTTHK